MPMVTQDTSSWATLPVTRRQVLWLLGGAGATVALAACGRGGSGTGGQGGTLRIAQTADPRTFNAVRQLEYWNWGGLYDSLLRYDANGKLAPHLAESYTISDDGKTVTVKLRSGVQFQSGRAFNGDDVKWILDKLKEPSTGALFRTFALAITSIEQPDSQTLVLHLDQPEAGIVDLLGNLYIPDKTVYDNIDRQGGGTGPFSFGEFVPGDHVTLKRNDKYWGQKAALGQIQVKIIGDPQASVANLESGTIDVTGVTVQDYVRLAQTNKYTMVKIVGASIYNIWLNTKRKPFDEKKARQAMAYALDRDRFNQTLLQGQSQPTCNPLPSYHWAFFPELDKTYTFDLDKAKSLFAEAGYPNGFETVINASSQTEQSTGMAQILQSDLAKIGVKATINAMDGPRWAEASDRGEFTINVHAYGRTNADPSLLFKGTTAWRPDANATGFSDPKYLELVNAQSRVIDREQRKPLLKELVQYIQDQCFVIPIAGNITAYALSKKVQGFNLLPVGPIVYMENVSLA